MMSLESIGIAVTILLGIATAAIKILEVIIHQTTADKFEEVKEDIEDELKSIGRRINRLERRVTALETKTFGKSDTFGRE